MIDHLIFVLYLYFFLFSSIGYGLRFSGTLNQTLQKLNLGWYGIIGFFLISIISIITSFFVSHNYLHNFIIHIAGLFFFIRYFFKNEQKKEYKQLFYISLSLIIGAYVFKNHDDFSYYHLTYALNLSENSFIVGTEILVMDLELFQVCSIIILHFISLLLIFIYFILVHFLF